MLSILAAFALDSILGDPYSFPHPVKYIGRFISWMEAKVRNAARSDNGLRFGGIVLALSTILSTWFLAYATLRFARSIHPWLYHALNILLLYTCFAAKCLADEGTKIAKVLAAGDIPGAQKLVSYIVGRDTDQLDESELTRATVETIAENTSDGVIAPLFFMLLGGAPLALAYKAVNTLDSMVGYKNEKYLHVGWASAKIDDAANFIPARLTGLLMVCAAFFMRLDTKGSFIIMKRDHANHSSPNCGYPEAAAAGALGVQLGGTNIYFGQPVYKPTIGDAHRKLTGEDIYKTIGLMRLATFIALVFASLAYCLIGVII